MESKYIDHQLKIKNKTILNWIEDDLLSIIIINGACSGVWK